MDFFINSESNDTEAERGVIDLFSNIFCSDVLDSIKECVYNGCNILIHTNDNNNTFTGISAANFAITPCGIWINYIATKGGHFLKKQYPNGDDQHFEGRGLGLFLIKSNPASFNVLFL